MYYNTELDYLRNVLDKLHLHTAIITPETISDKSISPEHIQYISDHISYLHSVRNIFGFAKTNTVYKISDSFLCNYVFMLLPNESETKLFLMGPYMVFDITHKQIMEEAERRKLSTDQFAKLQEYYSYVPVVKDEIALLAMINTFAEKLWESNKYEVVDINYEISGASSAFPNNIYNNDISDISRQMEILEKRYAYENKLIENVSKGLTHRAEQMLSNFSQSIFEQRVADPVRNIKNYIIISNTLLRKAAEQGGVHPIYLDNVSSEYARKLETITDAAQGIDLMQRMVRRYCRLVRKHSTIHYSAPIEKTIVHIESSLSKDLSLRALAAAQNINASYLSALFKKETGTTITDYVNKKRMKAAAHLLSSTKLQIQTIAQHCGIADVNYFTKLFKKTNGMTPKEFRESNRAK